MRDQLGVCLALGKDDRLRELRVTEPIIILSYAMSGAGRLGELLRAHPEVAWLPGLNVVQFCDRALREWCGVEEREAASALARKSVRSMLQTMVGVSMVASGHLRWCAAAIGTPGAAHSFAEVFPRARFVCLHRRCTDVIYSGVVSCPWGLSLGNYGFERFASLHPGDSVAALADYWLTNTEAMLAFEADHPGRYRRVLYEDLAERPTDAMDGVFEFLGLASPGNPDRAEMTPPPSGPAAVGCGSSVPLESIPGHITGGIRAVLDRLGYPDAMPADPGDPGAP